MTIRLRFEILQFTNQTPSLDQKFRLPGELIRNFLPFSSAGLFLEGASLDRKTGKLVESRPKVLYEQMPVIYIYAINTTAGKDSKLYECPIYRKPAR